MHRYIITGNGSKAIAVHSDMTWNEMMHHVRERSVPLHPDSTDRVFRDILGVDLVNPEVMLPNDFANRTPYLIGTK